MRRIIAVLLAITSTLFMMLGAVGCSSFSTDSFITVGQWLQMVDESFGMTECTTEEPFFENINKDDTYFTAAQIAAEWDVIDTNSALNVNDKLTWEFALLTLVNAGNFADEKTNDEKIKFAIDKFDTSIRKYWMNWVIEPKKAVMLLAKAQNMWATKTYDHNIEEVDFRDDVVDISKSIEPQEIQFDESGAVLLPIDKADLIRENDIYVLPATSDNATITAFKADEVIKYDDYILIRNSEEDIELEDIAENINIEEIFIPTAENAVIYDGNGEIISVGSEISQLNANNNDDFGVSNLLNTDTDHSITPLYDVQTPKQKHTFKVDDWKINLEYKLNGELDLKFTVETPNMLKKEYQESHPSQELTGNFGWELSNLKITNEVDYKWFKLNSASLRTDYEQSFSGGIKFSGKPVNKLNAPDYRNTGNFLTNWSKRVWKDADGENAKGAKTIKIASLDIYSIGICRVCLDINFMISAEGSISASITLRGAKGLEYRKGKTRLINTCDQDWDLDIQAKVEATLGVGPALYVVGLKKPIIGLQVRGGVGAALKAKFNLVDSSGHLLEKTDNSGFSTKFTDLMQESEFYSEAEQIKEIAESQGGTYDVVKSGRIKLHCDVCIDGSVYGIVRIQLTDSSYIAKFLGNKITTSWEIFGEKNGKLLDIHNDNGKWQFGYPGKPVSCTLKYVPFDNFDMESNESEDDEKDNEYIIKGDAIVLNEMYAGLSVNKNYYIQLKEIPAGYKTSDLICSTDDSAIATVTNDGVVTAKKAGSVVITISTSDKKYTTYLAITVTDTSDSEPSSAEVH